MRKLILAATGFVFLTGASYFIATAAGQQKRAAAPADDSAHKIGLIDIGYIFENYEKMKVLRQDTIEEMQEIEADFKKRVTNFQNLQAQLKQFTEGSPEAIERERKITEDAAKLEAHKKTMSRKMQRSQAQVYQTIYLEIQDMLKRVCERDGYTVVLRFTRDEMTNSDPQKVMADIARPVVYHRPGDDVTLIVLNALNRAYKPSAAATQGVAPAGGTKTTKPATRTADGKARAGKASSDE